MGAREMIQQGVAGRMFILFLAIVATATGLLAHVAYAIEKESQEQKASRLRQQAKGGLFRQWNFDTEPAGGIPTGFAALGVGRGSGTSWMVKADGTAPSSPNVVEVTTVCTDPLCYRMLSAEGLAYEYPDVTVRFRFGSNGGRGTAGLVFGLADEKNFYGALISLDKKSLEVIRVMNGNATVVGQAAVEPKSADWHTLRIQRNTIISKDIIETFFDGNLVLSLQDQALGIGQVGMLVQGTSSLQFDNFHAVPLFSQRPLSPPAAY